MILLPDSTQSSADTVDSICFFCFSISFSCKVYVKVPVTLENEDLSKYNTLSCRTVLVPPCLPRFVNEAMLRLRLLLFIMHILLFITILHLVERLIKGSMWIPQNPRGEGY